MKRALARQVIAGAIAFAAMSGCASAGASSASGSSQRSSRDVITAEDLASVKADNLYDAIQKLRPEFLRSDQAGLYGSPPPAAGKNDPSAGASSGSVQLVTDAAVPIMVYRDNVRLGSVDDLRQMQLSDVQEIRHLKGPQASVRFGTNNSAGAIVITSKK